LKIEKTPQFRSPIVHPMRVIRIEPFHRSAILNAEVEIVIDANVIRGVHDLLGEHGATPRPAEPFSDFVARALNLSRRQAEVFLQALHDGLTTEEATAKAEIDPLTVNSDLLERVARVIGTAVGELKKRA
jgi:DNA-directed RNA polymerase specialized sigma24 family protein